MAPPANISEHVSRPLRSPPGLADLTARGHWHWKLAVTFAVASLACVVSAPIARSAPAPKETVCVVAGQLTVEPDERVQANAADVCEQLTISTRPSPLMSAMAQLSLAPRSSVCFSKGMSAGRVGQR